MKKIIFIAIITSIAISCSNGDKNSELAKLKKQKQEIDIKIKQLESELSAGDSVKNMKQVGIMEIEPTEFNHFIELQGKIDGEENVIATSKNVGVITQIYVQDGQSVSKGQVLAELDMQVLKQTLSEVNTQLAFATNIYDKQKALWDQKIGSEVQYLTAKNQKESIENKIATLKDQLDMMRIKSPINGTIEEVSIKIGQSMAPGMVAFRVVNFSKVKVMLDVSEAYASKIKTGDEALVVFPDFEQEVNAKVSFASRFINPSNRSFQVEIRLNPGKLEFRANMIAIVKINDYTVKDALVVPVNVVQKGLNENYILIAVEKDKKNYVEKRKIKVGLTYNGLTEILEGIKKGDKVITSGFQNVNEGDIVFISK